MSLLTGGSAATLRSVLTLMAVHAHLDGEASSTGDILAVRERGRPNSGGHVHEWRARRRLRRLETGRAWPRRRCRGRVTRTLYYPAIPRSTMACFTALWEEEPAAEAPGQAARDGLRDPTPAVG